MKDELNAFEERQRIKHEKNKIKRMAKRLVLEHKAKTLAQQMLEKETYS